MKFSDRQWADAVTNFPLTIEEVSREYSRLPDGFSDVLYHYTNHAGLVGILKSGGLRATYRKKMNDPGEFSYARKIVIDALHEACDNTSDPIVRSFGEYTEKNLVRSLDDSPSSSNSYCACLTHVADDASQWKHYSENGKGFSIGFNLMRWLNTQRSKTDSGQSYLVPCPVLYEDTKQREFGHRLVRTCIKDFNRFREEVSGDLELLTAMRDRLTKEIVVHMFHFVNVFKAAAYQQENELRLLLEPNNGTFCITPEYFERGNEKIPYVFIRVRLRPV